MKKLLLLLLIIFTAGKVCAASPINVDYNDGIYHIVISGEKIKKQIQFISSSSLITNREAHFKNNSLLTINTGFFDPQNQKTISYIINDGQTIEDPIFNENIMSNAVLRQNMKKFLIEQNLGYLIAIAS